MPAWGSSRDIPLVGRIDEEAAPRPARTAGRFRLGIAHRGGRVLEHDLADGAVIRDHLDRHRPQQHLDAARVLHEVMPDLGRNVRLPEALVDLGLGPPAAGVVRLDARSELLGQAAQSLGRPVLEGRHAVRAHAAEARRGLEEGDRAAEASRHDRGRAAGRGAAHDHDVGGDDRHASPLASHSLCRHGSMDHASVSAGLRARRPFPSPSST
jgi:hypothetical protein